MKVLFLAALAIATSAVALTTAPGAVNTTPAAGRPAAQTPQTDVVTREQSAPERTQPSVKSSIRGSAPSNDSRLRTDDQRRQSPQSQNSTTP